MAHVVSCLSTAALAISQHILFLLSVIFSFFGLQNGEKCGSVFPKDALNVLYSPQHIVTFKKLETENSDYLLLKMNKSINKIVANQFINYVVSYFIILIT